MRADMQVEGPIDISIVVNLHGEGLLLHRTLTSVVRATEYARAHGCATEVVLVE